MVAWNRGSLSVLTIMLICLSACGEGGKETGEKEDTSGDLPTCVDPVTVELTTGGASGYLECDDGSVNRQSVVTLKASDYVDLVPECSEAVDEDERGCFVDTDCGAEESDQCFHRQASSVPDDCVCIRLCGTDGDCPAGEVCMAPEVMNAQQQWPTCQPASCYSNDDCPSGECGVSARGDQAATNAELACRTPSDQCRVDSDCGSSFGDVCEPSAAEGSWECGQWWYYD